MDGKITTGSTITFRLSADKDGVDWDLDTPSTATVKLYLADPDGTELAPFTATLTSPDSGIADFTVASTVLNKVGTWLRQWLITQGTIQIPSQKIAFSVAQGR